MMEFPMEKIENVPNQNQITIFGIKQPNSSIAVRVLDLGLTF